MKLIICTFSFLLIVLKIQNSPVIAQEILNLEERITELSLLASQGDSNAQFELGQIALETRNPPDHSGAAYWFRIAAEANHIEAQVMLGALLFSGMGVPLSHEEAYKWWKKAAFLGSMKAQASLGVLYGLGMGVNKNNIEAYKWLTIAAYFGNEEAQKQRDESVSLQMSADEIREAQKRIEETIKIIKKNN